MSSAAPNTYLGKYREIILAVTFFLIFDLAVLVLNFYISFQISESAAEINLAGRQRMLSQRMTKELLTAAQDRQQATGSTLALEELQKSIALFDSTLDGFKHGGLVTGGDGQKIHIKAITTADGRRILDQAETLWIPLREMVNGLASERFNDADLYAAAAYARQHNLELLALMNRLTTSLEQAANGRADTLRLVQTGGILLAMLNFAFILFKFLRRLRENDRKIEQAQSETAEILETVREGLFLLDHDFRIGSQFSASLAKILGRPIQEGGDFRAILRDMIPPDAYKSAYEYIGLLLGNRVKEALVQDLNPLTNMAVLVPDAKGERQQRYLTLQFSRALKDGAISHLLVTAFDVTAQVELEQALVEARKKAKAEVEVMIDLLKVNPATLKQFLDRAEMTLLEINDHLRHADGSRDYRRTIALIFRQVHSLKGEAAALGLEIFEELAQKFEAMLSELRNKGSVSGDDLLALPLPLDEFLQRIADIRELSARLAAYQSSFPGEDGEGALVKNMTALAQRIAGDHGKDVALSTELELMDLLPHRVRNDLGDIALQLLRNAIVHGIEDIAERSALDKPLTGQVRVALRRYDDEYELLLEDDGRGLIPERIRAELLRRGLYTPEQLAELGDRQIVMKIFEPGFSTATSISRDAGHGVGMDVVRHKIQQLGARLRIATKKDAYTQFYIRFAV